MKGNEIDSLDTSYVKKIQKAHRESASISTFSAIDTIKSQDLD